MGGLLSSLKARRKKQMQAPVPQRATIPPEVAESMDKMPTSAFDEFLFTEEEIRLLEQMCEEDGHTAKRAPLPSRRTHRTVSEQRVEETLGQLRVPDETEEEFQSMTTKELCEGIFSPEEMAKLEQLIAEDEKNAQTGE